MSMQGKVKWFNNAKGYGFINSDSVDEDIFVHYRDVVGEGYKTLKEEQRVEFVMVEQDKGYCAKEVVPA